MKPEGLPEIDPILPVLLTTMLIRFVRAPEGSMIFFFKTIKVKALNAMPGFAILKFLDVALG